MSSTKANYIPGRGAETRLQALDREVTAIDMVNRSAPVRLALRAHGQAGMKTLKTDRVCPKCNEEMPAGSRFRLRRIGVSRLLAVHVSC